MTEIERLQDILDTINNCSRDSDHFDKLDSILTDEHHQAEDGSIYKKQLKTLIRQQRQSFQDSSKSHKKSNYGEFTTEFEQCVSFELSRLKGLR